MGASNSDEESISLKMPQGALQMIDHGIAGIPHPSTPPSPSPPPHTPTPPPPPPLFSMANTTKTTIFNGLGTEDPDQFWFVADVVWKSQQIIYDDMKKEHLVTALQDRAERWHINYSMIHPADSLKDTKD